ncbi:MAG: PTS mannose/fructose/sorbose transporter subunit IIC [Aerococcus sp.]|nr:PTS mannose/fructose/sorbose transporter subunit IIC [Aerococcus sp.]
MTAISYILVFIVALLAGFGSILDQFEMHQPIITCTLIGIVTGHPMEGLLLGGQMQLIVLGWMNIGAAASPDTALAGVVSSILVCIKGAEISEGIALAIPLAIAGQLLTIFVRTLTVGLGHYADKTAAEGSARGIVVATYVGLAMQGLRIALPALAVLAVPTELVTNALQAIPEWLTGGLNVGGGMIVAVGYAMVINMMATRQNWPFFFLGFALSAISSLNLVAMGIIGLVLAIVYVQIAPQFNNNQNGGTSSGGGSVDDALDAILEDYE